jgi:hypothetical protein
MVEFDGDVDTMAFVCELVVELEFEDDNVVELLLTLGQFVRTSWVELFAVTDIVLQQMNMKFDLKIGSKSRHRNEKK